MGKYLKIFLSFFLGIAAIIAGVLVTAHLNYQATARAKTEDPPSLQLGLPLNPSWVDEGRRVAATRGCADCHGKDMGGQVFIEDPGMGYFAGSNLTKGRGGLPADYATEDMIRAIRHGKARDGSYLQFMPSIEYSHMSDEDLGKLIVYLQSLPPVDRELGEPAPGPVAKLMFLMDKMPLLFSGLNIPARVEAPVTLIADESPAYGQYLATSCIGCHGPSFAGGAIPGVPPSWPEAANLTQAGPSAKWSFEQFRSTLKTGTTPEGKILNPKFMPWTATAALNDSELKALYNFLQTLPAAHPE